MTVGRTDKVLGHGDAIRFINETLKGPVAEIFRALVPAFGDIAGPDFYDTVMASSELLHGCILIFRRHRDQFRSLLVDARGRPVNDDFVQLRCGRSVHDIIAMIVRTHAKRHFKETLGGDPNDPKSRAGRMYQAMNEYLIHDWQVPLVPHYAPMPVEKVLEMGPRILDVREAELLDAITAAASGWSSPPPSHGLPATRPPLPPRFEVGAPAQSATVVARRGGAFMPVASVQSFSGTPQEEFWWEAMTDKKAVEVLGSRSGHEMREMVAALAGVNETVRSELFAGLSLSTVQAAVCLSTAYRVMGRNVFNQVFGMPGKAQMVEAVAGRMRKRNVNSRTELKALVGLTEGAVRG
ncbi:hypothetical protein CU669_15865 [Paramagnetospirillum kuznetsovii]|uniref:Uncharacterized protein n=1 Tax=Paramagnetospirillum kuznetsovii TaxID=2053833 RepID=A0A364NV37_9PROT|nr:hypothetical protein CU669_15865 [Paramagnetospirillum kuznetsovii]